MNRLGSAYTTRCQLHTSKLLDFTDFCSRKGWWVEPTVGEYEVLRMRKEGNKIPLLVYRKAKVTEHYTVSGVALIMVAAYLKEKRDGERKEGQPDQTPAVVAAPEVVQACVLESGTTGTQESDPPWK